MEYRRVNGYRVEQRGDGLWALDDERQASMDLVEGTECALLIDTGMCRESPLPVLRMQTDKPIDLALTHAHVDHMEHADASSARLCARPCCICSANDHPSLDGA